MPSPNGPLRVGIGGPVGSGKTALMEQICKRFRDTYDIAAITNDIYTKEDARILTEAGALEQDRIMGVETGGCPHTAIREDASMNLAAIKTMRQRFPNLDLVLIESGGDNLAATFSPELADLTIYVIDVSGGEKIPRKGGPGITRSDLLVINKTDPRAFRGRVARRDGAGCPPHARHPALCVHQHAERRRSRHHHGLYRERGRLGARPGLIGRGAPQGPPVRRPTPSPLVRTFRSAAPPCSVGSISGRMARVPRAPSLVLSTEHASPPRIAVAVRTTGAERGRRHGGRRQANDQHDGTQGCSSERLHRRSPLG